MHVIEILGMMAAVSVVALSAIRSEQVRRQAVPVRVKRHRN